VAESQDNKDIDPLDPLHPLRTAYVIADNAMGQMREMRRMTPGAVLAMSLTIVVSIAGGIASASYVAGNAGNRLDTVEYRQKIIEQKLDEITRAIGRIEGILEESRS
jgi:hypothetical protein